MVNFTAEQFRELMHRPTNIRNMSVIAHVVTIYFGASYNNIGPWKNNVD